MAQVPGNRDTLESHVAQVPGNGDIFGPKMCAVPGNRDVFGAKMSMEPGVKSKPVRGLWRKFPSRSDLKIDSSLCGTATVGMLRSSRRTIAHHRLCDYPRCTQPKAGRTGIILGGGEHWCSPKTRSLTLVIGYSPRVCSRSGSHHPRRGFSENKPSSPAIATHTRLPPDRA